MFRFSVSERTAERASDQCQSHQSADTFSHDFLSLNDWK